MLSSVVSYFLILNTLKSYTLAKWSEEFAEKVVAGILFVKLFWVVLIEPWTHVGQ